MHYFDVPGKANTDVTLDLAITRAKELDIKYMVVASTKGKTCEKLLAKHSGLNIICITHQLGFKGPGIDEMDADMRSSLEQQGAKLLTCTHLFWGIDRAVRNKFQGVYPAEIVAQTLRILGQGMKVAVEIACTALDAGLVPYGEEIISIGGFGRGADTAIVTLPAYSHQFFDTEVREIICMPRRKTKKSN